MKRYHKENDVLIEKWVLSNVQHPGMVKLFHTFQDVGALYLVLDLVEGGELWNYTHGRGIRQSLAAFYTAEILEVLQHLHEHKVVHRDVKPENVLVTKTGHIKLIDFGTAKVISPLPPPYHLPTASLPPPYHLPTTHPPPPTTTLRVHPIPYPPAKVLTEEWTGKQPKGKWKEFVGTPEYMAPEAINNVPSDYRFDLWSLGCVICQLLSGQPPFKGKSDFLTFKRVARCAYLMPEGMPPAAASMIRQLLVINAPERLGGGAEIDEPEAKRHAAIRSHPWFVEQLAGCATQLHERSLCVSAPLPVASLQELCAPIVGERLAEAGDWQSAAMRGPPVQEWPQSVRQQVVFELTKRRKLSERRMRDAMLLGPEPVGISDAEIVREDMGEAEAMEGGDAKEKKKGGGGDADAAGVLV